MNLYAGDGRKTPKYVQNENQGKILRLVALPSPLYEDGGRLFSGVRKKPKQTGPTLGGTGILL